MDIEITQTIKELKKEFKDELIAGVSGNLMDITDQIKEAVEAEKEPMVSYADKVKDLQQESKAKKEVIITAMDEKQIEDATAIKKILQKTINPAADNIRIKGLRSAGKKRIIIQTTTQEEKDRISQGELMKKLEAQGQSTRRNLRTTCGTRTSKRPPYPRRNSPKGSGNPGDQGVSSRQGEGIRTYCPGLPGEGGHLRALRKTRTLHPGLPQQEQEGVPTVTALGSSRATAPRTLTARPTGLPWRGTYSVQGTEKTRIARNQWGMNSKNLYILYKGLVESIILYGAEIWGGTLNKILMKKLLSLQRNMLLLVSKAYRTVSGDALQVITGTLPIDLKVKERIQLYKWKKTKEIESNRGKITIEHRGEALREIRKILIGKWQERWNMSDKGRWTFRLIKQVKIKADYKLEYYNTQVLTGHGNFLEKLAGLKLRDETKCSCGRIDNVEHMLIDCPLYEDIRIKHLELAIKQNWKNNLEELLRKENYKHLRTFGKLALKRKEELEATNNWM
ncbi:hypothetical protein J437_LFUL006123 [Ladona fulva]|uniref:Reverse transcriptase n=1 Tax=Ladona fulva TaxID=123851 RepID=A0A8K0K860_LADFU|nr:hypothetical protein J437_LFUL006123 [Ladona fulva]